jgi:signal peptidase I
MFALPFRPGIIVGESMSPSFHHGQMFLMKRFSPGASLAKGEVVIFDFAGQRMVKRVAALPGETVTGLDWSGDGKPHHLLATEQIPRMKAFLQRHPSVGHLVQLSVPPGQVFLVGDWPSGSVDSREFGPVPVGDIRGVLVSPRAQFDPASPPA